VGKSVESKTRIGGSVHTALATGFVQDVIVKSAEGEQWGRTREYVNRMAPERRWPHEVMTKWTYKPQMGEEGVEKAERKGKRKGQRPELEYKEGQNTRRKCEP
tara:strand:+ start:177 stop:485 length:309 start_codon:yes stop_codon:yes gene_type:complete